MMKKIFKAAVAAMAALLIASCSENVNRNIFPYMQFEPADEEKRVAMVTLLKAMETLDDLPKEVKIDGKVYTVSMFGGYGTPEEAGKAEAITLPEQINSIRDDAFKDAGNLKKAVIEAEGVDTSGAGFADSTEVYNRSGELYSPFEYAYDEASRTATVTIKRNRGNGESPTIPASTKKDGEEYAVTTFGGYTDPTEAGKATSLTLPSTITAIAKDALSDAIGLKSLTIEAEGVDISSIALPDSLTSLAPGGRPSTWSLPDMADKSDERKFSGWYYKNDSGNLIRIEDYCTVPEDTTVAYPMWTGTVEIASDIGFSSLSDVDEIKAYIVRVYDEDSRETVKEVVMAKNADGSFAPADDSDRSFTLDPGTYDLEFVPIVDGIEREDKRNTKQGVVIGGESATVIDGDVADATDTDNGILTISDAEYTALDGVDEVKAKIYTSDGRSLEAKLKKDTATGRFTLDPEKIEISVGEWTIELTPIVDEPQSI